MSDRTPLETVLIRSGLSDRVDGPALGRLEGYVALLRHWNRAFNLVAPGDEQRLEDRHVLDSLQVLELLGPGPLADVGSGAGFPGMVLALVEPQRSVTLIDSNGRRTRFLQQVKVELALDNLTVRQARLQAEEAPEGLQGAFAEITARAVAPLERLVPWCRPLLASQGTLRVLISERQAREIEAKGGPGGEALGGENSPDRWSLSRYRLPGEGEDRAVLSLGPGAGEPSTGLSAGSSAGSSAEPSAGQPCDDERLAGSGDSCGQ